MREKTFHVYVDSHDRSLLLQSLVELKMNILALQYRDSGKLSTDVPDVDTGIDWLVYLAQYSQQCQAQSHFVVRSRLDTVENTEIMAGSNQAFYCGTLRPDCRPFRTGIFIEKSVDPTRPIYRLCR